MFDRNGLTSVVQAKKELGMVICKKCNEVLYTLPTNGVKKIYGLCSKKECLEKQPTNEGDSL